MKRYAAGLLFASLFVVKGALGAIEAPVIHVAAGESIQKAIDAAPAGATVNIDAGTFAQRLNITRPITLRGAGPDKTILKPVDGATEPSDAEKLAFVDQLEKAKTDTARARLTSNFLHRELPSTITVKSTGDVTLRGLRFQGPSPSFSDGLMSGEALLDFDSARGQVIDCAIVGPFMNGIAVTNGSDVELHESLVAAMWNTGVAIEPGRDPNDKPAKAHLENCDIRNCYSRCITISGEGTIIEKCQISGSAWHGIRYDECSPTITGNLIFANARSGIYASGSTHAIVRGNVFWKNEMDGISCWFNNSDTIQGNTIVGNLREGIAVCGDATPSLGDNIFMGNPIGIVTSQVNQRGTGVGNPQPQIGKNWFWKNDIDLQRLQKTEPLPSDCVNADPKFTDEARHDFSLAADSPARQAGMGAAVPVSFESPWPIQSEEKSIIPETDTRDYAAWKKPPGIR